MDVERLQAAMSQVFSGFMAAVDSWLVTVLLAALFAAALFRPQQIHDPVLFRGAIRLLVAYLILPVGAGLLLLFEPPASAAAAITHFSALLGRCLLAWSIVRALRSVMPTQDPRRP